MNLSVLRPKLTYANVTATLALVIALSGGAAYAATKIKPNSVGTEQLKDNAVTTQKVLDGTLLSSDFQPGQLPSVSGLEVIYATSGGGAATSKDVEAQCPSGKVVTGGGYIIAGGGTNARVTTSAPGQVPNPTSWYVAAKEPTATGATWTLTAYAVCASAA